MAGDEGWEDVLYASSGDERWTSSKEARVRTGSVGVWLWWWWKASRWGWAAEGRGVRSASFIVPESGRRGLGCNWHDWGRWHRCLCV